MKRSLFDRDGSAGRRGGREEADDLAVEMLTFLAHDPERLHRFFEVTGLTVAALREVAGTPAFNASLITHVCSDETMLRAFAASCDRDPAEVDAVRMRLG